MSNFTFKFGAAGSRTEGAFPPKRRALLRLSNGRYLRLSGDLFPTFTDLDRATALGAPPDLALGADDDTALGG